MTQGAPPRRRPNREYRWTREKAFAFLDALVECGTVDAAARQVGMSRQSAYLLRRREGESFGRAWDAALVLAMRLRLGREQAELRRLAAPLFAS